MKDKSTPSFSESYGAAKGADADVAVCGFVNGKRFVGLLTKPEGGPTECPFALFATRGDLRLAAQVLNF